MSAPTTAPPGSRPPLTPAPERPPEARPTRSPREELPFASELHLLEKGHLQYRFDSRSYSQAYGWWKRREVVSREVARAVAGIAHPRILEVGCHKGSELMGVAGASPVAGLLVGADLSLDFVRFASRWSKTQEVPSARWAAADALRLPFADRSFDVLVATEVVEHLPEPVRALSEFGRVLRSGGAVILSTVNPGSGMAALGRLVNRMSGGRLRRAVRDGVEDVHHGEHEHDAHSYLATAECGTRDLGHVSELPLARWAELLKQAGFERPRIVPGSVVYGGRFYDRHRLLFAAFLTFEGTIQKLPGFARWCNAGTVVASRPR